jgi:hypothetical protein
MIRRLGGLDRPFRSLWRGCEVSSEKDHQQQGFPLEAIWSLRSLTSFPDCQNQIPSSNSSTTTKRQPFRRQPAKTHILLASVMGFNPATMPLNSLTSGVSFGGSTNATPGETVCGVFDLDGPAIGGLRNGAVR